MTDFENPTLVVPADRAFCAGIVTFNANIAVDPRQRCCKRDIRGQSNGIGSTAGGASAARGVSICGRNGVCQTAACIHCNARGLDNW